MGGSLGSPVMSITESWDREARFEGASWEGLGRLGSFTARGLRAKGQQGQLVGMGNAEVSG